MTRAIILTILVFFMAGCPDDSEKNGYADLENTNPEPTLEP